MWRAMQQFEGRSAATVLRDDAQRSRVEAHAVQLNLEAHGGWWVVVVLNLARHENESNNVFGEWFLFEESILITISVPETT